jgi:hypothetical protein
MTLYTKSLDLSRAGSGISVIQYKFRLNKIKVYEITSGIELTYRITLLSFKNYLCKQVILVEIIK